MAEALYKALHKLNETNESDVFNLSSERGYSVLDILNYCQNIIGKEINYNLAERRKGDPDVLISDCSKAGKLLNWKPQNSDIRNIIKSAWNWHKFLRKNLL